MASPPPLLPFTSAGTPPTLVASGPAHSAEMVVAPTAPPEVSLTHRSVGKVLFLVPNMFYDLRILKAGSEFVLRNDGSVFLVPRKTSFSPC